MDSVVTPDPQEPILRPYRQKDLPFIYDSWTKSHWAGIKGFQTHRGTHDKYLGLAINRIITRPSATILAACLPDDDSIMCGWAAYELRSPMLLHYVYVNHAFRRMGLGKTLVEKFPERPIIYTHQTSKGKRLMLRYHALFNPWILGAI